MRLWTIQGIEIYEQLMRDGVTYCTKPLWGDDETFMYAYHWMTEQMKKRIGESPIDGIKYPMWAWYQYDSAKKNKPPKRPSNVNEGVSVYMEIDLPDNKVLLSDFSNWHAVLNQCPLSNWKSIDRKTNVLDKKAGRRLDFKEYPIEIRKEIEDSWEAIFYFDRRNGDVGRTHKRNRSIQATFWSLAVENVISVEILERKGNIIKLLEKK